jgi:hypothetical protein
MKKVLALGIPLLLVLTGLYLWAFISWSYSDGERAGWVQKFSRKGWICKTWEGELAMVSMPGTTTEKFYFTVWNDNVAAQINEAMGRRVSLHYAEKVGLPGSCFGDTRYWVDRVTVVPEIPLGPGVMVPVPPAAVPQTPMTPEPAAGAIPAQPPAVPTAPGK